MNDYLREMVSYFGLYRKMFGVRNKKNTHSWYTAGMFLENRKENKGLEKFFSWIEKL